MRAFLLFGLLAFLIGCDTSRNGLYSDTKEDTVFDDRLVGRWEDENVSSSDANVFFVERVGDTNQYRFSEPKRNKQPVYFGYLVPIGDDRIFDVVCQDNPSEHMFFRIHRDGENRVVIDIVDFGILKAKPELLAHKSDPIFGSIPYKFTATTDELRDFFREHSKEIWDPPKREAVRQRKADKRKKVPDVWSLRRIE